MGRLARLIPENAQELGTQETEFIVPSQKTGLWAHVTRRTLRRAIRNSSSRTGTGGHEPPAESFRLVRIIAPCGSFPSHSMKTRARTVLEPVPRESAQGVFH